VAIRERRRWMPVWGAALMGIPATMVVVGLWAIADRPREWMTGGPLLVLMLYSLLVAMVNRTMVDVDERGFRLGYGPLPCAAGGERHAKDAVKELFPRHMRVGVGRGAVEDHYFAAVEVADGRWVNVLGPYADWAGASLGCGRIAPLWGVTQIGAGRQGVPAGWRDWRTARTLLWWLLAYVAAFTWAIVQTIRLGQL